MTSKFKIIKTYSLSKDLRGYHFIEPKTGRKMISAFISSSGAGEIFEWDTGITETFTEPTDCFCDYSFLVKHVNNLMYNGKAKAGYNSDAETMWFEV